MNRTLLTWILAGVLVPGVALAEAGWKSRAELSYTRTGGNSDTEALAGKLETGLDAGANRYAAKASGLYGETEGDQTASRWTAEGRYERLLTERLFGFLSVGYLKDTFAGYDTRLEVGPGVGYDVLKLPDHDLKVMLGVLWNYDNFANGDEGSDTYLSGKAAGDYEWRISEGLTFKQYLDYSVSFDDTDVYFINSESSLAVQMAENLALGVSYIVNYQNQPPAPGADHVDTKFMTSLVVDF